MKKSYYILLTITATAAVLYLLGNWVGRSFGLNRQQVIRNIHEAYGRATEDCTFTPVSRFGYD